MRTALVPFVIAAVAAGGCAKKAFVQRQVGELNHKLDAVSSEVEKTQERVGQAEARIDEVDRSSRSGIDEARSSAQAAMERASQAENAARGQLLYSVTLSNDDVRFAPNRFEISDDARRVIDEVVAPLAAANSGVYIEIEGHTDSTGSGSYNRRLGEERAEAVRDYIARSHAVALSRLGVISYGEEKPLAGNETREGRAANRRVVIRVLG